MAKISKAAAMGMLRDANTAARRPGRCHGCGGVVPCPVHRRRREKPGLSPQSDTRTDGSPPATVNNARKNAHEAPQG